MMYRRYLTNVSRGRCVHTALDETTTRLCAIAGFTASGNLAKLSKLWSQLPENEHAAGTEIVLQNLVYNGMPRTLMALNTITEVGVKDRIVCDPYPSSASKRAEFTQAGHKTVSELYGYKSQRFMMRMRLLHPAVGRWMNDFFYGRVRSRPGVSQKVRSLCELAAIGGQFVFPQFRGGIMVALTSGATIEEVRAVLDMTNEIWGPERQAMVDSLWRDLNIRRLIGGWKDERKSSLNLDLHPGEVLKPNWAHLLEPSEIPSPNWRHPDITSLRQVVQLSDRTRVFAFAAAHSAAGNLSSLRRDWTFLTADQHRAGLEMLLETVAFCGFHRLSNALRSVHEQGVATSAILPQKEDSLDSSSFPASGESLLQQIYTSSYGPLNKSISKLHPDVWTWIVEFLYGQVLSRDCPGLSVAERELGALACMVGSVTFPQLRSHMRGALNCGASLEQVRGILDQTSIVWGRPEQANIDGYWLDFLRDRAGSQVRTTFF